MEAELAKLEYNLGGVRNMQKLPQAVFIVDLKTEEIALREASRLRIPVIALVDTNCDPDPVDHVVPGNDDAIRSCELITATIGEAVEGAAGAWREQERKRREEEEHHRRQEEERQRKEAEEKAKRDAEAAAAAAAEQAKVAAAAAAQAEPAAAGAEEGGK